jgi:hypothetical protein
VDFQGIFDAIGDFFDNPIIQFGLRALAIYIVVLWLAAAYWAFRDLQHRTTNPILPYLAAALIVLFTPVFFLLAVIVYRIVRPAERIGEVSERQLAEEALLAEDWIICPTCRTRLNRVCPNCGKLVGLDWSLCAWCGKDFERREAAMIEPLPAVDEPAAVTSRASARGSSRSAPAAARHSTPRSGTRGGGTLGSADPLSEH